MFKCKRKYKTRKKKKERCFFADFKFNQSFIDTLWFIYNNCNILLKCTVHPLVSLFPFPILRDPTSFVDHSCISLVCKEITVNL